MYFIPVMVTKVSPKEYFLFEIFICNSVNVFTVVFF